MSFFGLNALKEVSIIVLAAVAIYILINVMRESKGSSNVENTSLVVSILPDPVLLPIIIASFPLGTREVTAVGMTFIVASALALIAVVAAVTAGLAKSLPKLKPTTVDKVVVVALALTAVYIYFFG